MKASEYLKLHAPGDWQKLIQIAKAFDGKLVELEYQGEIKKRDNFNANRLQKISS